jgi:hypothetical protein
MAAAEAKLETRAAAVVLAITSDAPTGTKGNILTNVVPVMQVRSTPLMCTCWQVTLPPLQ